MGKGWSFPPSAFAVQIDEEVSKRVRNIALALLGEIIEKSPVDTGRFRGNNIVSIGSPVYTSTTDVDPSGNETIRRGGAVLSGLEPYTQVFIQNNLPYAERLENGHSSQAPTGIYGLSFIGVSEVYK
ncbi:HK97 gp10 family phage protein [Pseudomonas sp. Irchel s3f7]|jgi:hypothetical protein|uniref:HK97 gp10 family phage protein n=1 Tax=Pseudomonas sp. Irchel s3f7 TaxID=2009153 RepID=UPI000BA31883|nr:HK97 gp10 family phage protein [Pseudomonas sp. Irchel s3f7]